MCSDVSIKKNPSGELFNTTSDATKTGYFFVLCVAGRVTLECHSLTEDIPPCSIVLVPCSMDGCVLKAGAGFEGFSVFLSRVYLDSFHLNVDNSCLWDMAADIQICQLKKQKCDSIATYMEALHDSLTEENSCFRSELVFSAARALTCRMLLAVSASFATLPDRNSHDRREQLVKAFLALIQEHGSRQRCLEFYASELCISPKYLSFVVSKCTGRKALSWIEEYAINRACSMLKSTDLSINQISDVLNFSSPSDFCRYFRKRTGVTPRAFRLMK